MKNNIKAIEQVMTEKEKIALRLYNQYTTPETGVIAIQKKYKAVDKGGKIEA